MKYYNIPLKSFILKKTNDKYNIKGKKDDRGYLESYWPLLKIKQMFIFTFCTYTNNNIVKICIDTYFDLLFIFIILINFLFIYKLINYLYLI